MPQVGEWLARVFGQIRGFLTEMPGYQRASFIGVSIAFVAGFVGFVWWASQPVFRSVFGNLSESDAAAIVEYLQEEKIPYRLEHGGRAVLVPAEQVYEVRLALARAGLPQGGSVGFEIFDEQKLGMTDFLQRLNYTRALQGELGRTISQITGVSAARVLLVIPERSLFVSEDRRATASVVITLAPGKVLGASTVAGIVHLVASSVEGLSPDDVAVVDNAGQVLAGKNQGVDGSGLSSGMLDYQRTIERGLEERVESMLGRVVGREKVSARVSVTLNLTRMDKTEERVDPDQTAVRSERLSREESTGSRAAAGGTPGIADNLTNEARVPSEGSRTERRDETVSYDVTKVTSHTVGATGQIEMLSVAVLVDGTYEERGGTQTFVPRPQEELDRYSELVKSAVGFSEGRGDRVEMASVAFHVPEVLEEAWWPTLQGVLSTAGALVPRIIGVVVILAFFLFVARPALQRLASEPGVRGGVSGQGRIGSAGDVDQLVQRLEGENRRLTTEDPEQAAYLVRQWLSARD